MNKAETKGHTGPTERNYKLIKETFSSLISPAAISA